MKEEKRPEYCKHPFGVRCIYGRNDYGWNVECKTCTKWNRKLQVSNFEEEEKRKKKAQKQKRVFEWITFGIIMVIIIIYVFSFEPQLGYW